MEFKDLYKRDSKGNIRIFKMRLVPGNYAINGKAGVITEAGILGKKLVANQRPITGKNIGKSNQTTALEQAMKEARAMFASKQKDGYKTLAELGWTKHLESVTTIEKFLLENLPEGLDGQGVMIPMLLYEARTPSFPVDKKLRKKPKRKDVTFPCFAQIKRDGVCAMATPGNDQVFTTRGGKDRLTPKGQKWDYIVSHLVEQLNFFWEKLEEAGHEKLPFHGEIYIHGKTLQEIQKANKKLNIDSKDLEFHIFDVCDVDKNQAARRDHIHEELGPLLLSWQESGKCKNLQIVKSHLVNDEDHLLRIEDIVLTRGYEGIVIRHLDGMYIPGSRSKDVLKMVRMDDNEFEITGVAPMSNAPTLGMFICKHDTKEFKVVPQFTTDEKRLILLQPDKYIGKMLKCKHRGYTDDGVPRIATGVAIREPNT